MGDLCIAVITNKKYEKYAPYFVWASQRSYPEYAVKIFSLDKLSEKVKGYLVSLGSASKVELVESFFSDFPRSNQELKTFRWLVSEEYFLDHKYIYIGDIDMLICKESPGLLERHKKHCNDTGLPYSNCVRPNTRRLSGLHFFDRERYYDAMRGVIDKYTKMLRNNKLGLRTGVRNEEVLYDMVLSAGLDLPPDKFRIDINGSGPHHGLHLGIWRKGTAVKPDLVSQIMADCYMEYFDYFSKISKEEPFLKLERDFPLKEISRMRNFFKKYKKSK